MAVFNQPVDGDVGYSLEIKVDPRMRPARSATSKRYERYLLPAEKFDAWIGLLRRRDNQSVDQSSGDDTMQLLIGIGLGRVRQNH